jgi:RimJ/RimL family protein N-acetyltransferase
LPNLETPRLILRAFQDADLEAFAAYRGDPAVARFQGWRMPYTLAMAAAFIDEMKNARPATRGDWYQFALERKQAPGLIGDVAFHLHNQDFQQAEIGFTLAAASQGQGYAGEAVRRLLEYLFNELRLHRVTAGCDVRNEPSYRLMERLGMRREAHFVESFEDGRAWGSEYRYAILRREFSSQK